MIFILYFILFCILVLIALWILICVCISVRQVAEQCGDTYWAYYHACTKKRATVVHPYPEAEEVTYIGNVNIENGV